MKYSIYIPLLFCLFSCYELKSQDTIYLKDGNTLEGYILKADQFFIKYRSRYKKSRIPLYEVSRVKYESGEQSYFNVSRPVYRRSVSLALIVPGLEFEQNIAHSRWSVALQASVGLSGEDVFAYGDGDDDLSVGPVARYYFSRQHLMGGPYAGVGVKFSFYNGIPDPSLNLGWKFRLSNRFYLEPSLQAGPFSISWIGLVVLGYRFHS